MTAIVWTFLGIMVLGLVVDIARAYAPKPKHRTEEEVRQSAVVGIVMNAAIIVWILVVML